MSRKEEIRNEIKVLELELENLTKPQNVKWYIITNGIAFKLGDGNINYGVWHDRWRTDLFINKGTVIREATGEEVLKELTKIAIEKGFVDGVNIEVEGNVCTVSGNIKFEFNNNELNIFGNKVETKHDGFIDYHGHLPILENGKWAKVIKDKTITLNGDYTKSDLKKIIKTKF